MDENERYYKRHEADKFARFLSNFYFAYFMCSVAYTIKLYLLSRAMIVIAIHLYIKIQ